MSCKFGMNCNSRESGECKREHNKVCKYGTGCNHPETCGFDDHTHPPLKRRVNNAESEIIRLRLENERLQLVLENQKLQRQTQMFSVQKSEFKAGVCKFGASCKFKDEKNLPQNSRLCIFKHE